MVGHPSAAAVLQPCRGGSSLAQLAHHAHQRLVQLAQVAWLGRPVVHLGVYVYCIAAPPRRVELGVPLALQVGGLASGLRRAYEQVAAKLEIERHEVVVGCVLEVAYALVGGLVGIFVGPEVEAHAVELLLVAGYVGSLGLGIGAVAGRHVLVDALPWVGRYVLVVDEVGGHGHIDGHGVGPAHYEAVARCRHRAAFIVYLGVDNKPHLAGHGAAGGLRGALHGERGAPGAAPGGVAFGVCQRRREVEPAALRCRVAYHEQLVG